MKRTTLVAVLLSAMSAALCAAGQVESKERTAEACSEGGVNGVANDKEKALATISACDHLLKGKSLSNDARSTALNYKGIALLALKQDTLALKVFDQAIDVNPSNINAILDRAVALRRLKRLSEAELLFKDALRKSNILNSHGYFVCNYNLGKIAYENGNYEAAISFYDNALRYEPKTPEAYRARGLSKDALGQTQEAIADYKTFSRLRSEPSSSE